MKNIADIKYTVNYNLLQRAKKELQNVSHNSNYKENLIIDSYNSATIEGARTTVERVKKSLNNPKTKDDKMVANNVKVLHRIYSGMDINENHIRLIWEELVKGACENTGIIGSKYRSGIVYVSDGTEVKYTPPSADEIPELMDKMFKYMDSKEDSITRAIMSHLYFVIIHPFCDGNGRMARLITNYILFKTGYSNVKYISISNVIRQNIKEYYRTISKAEEDNCDASEFVNFMLKVIIKACDVANKSSIEISDTAKAILRRMKNINSEITVSKASKIIGKTEGYTRTVLNDLCDKNIMTRRKIGNKFVYSKTVHF